MKTKLTDKQLRFVQEYIVDRNATAAAVRAGYAEHSAHAQGHRLIKDKLINMAIAKLTREQQHRTKIDADWLLNRLAVIASFNLKNFIVINEQGLPCYDFSNATDDDWYCINECTVDQIMAHGEDLIPIEKVKIKTLDKMRALEAIGRLSSVAAFDKPETNIHIHNSIEDRLVAGRERARKLNERTKH